MTVTAALSEAFAISFAALVYKGSVDSLLPQGIGVTLLGAAVVGLLGSFSYAFRGTVTVTHFQRGALLGEIACNADLPRASTALLRHISPNG